MALTSCITRPTNSAIVCGCPPVRKLGTGCPKLATSGVASGTGGEFGTQVIQSPVIYLSMPWFSEYFSAAVADTDFAIAYVVAHEVAHHIEYLLGYIDSTGRGCCGYIDEQIELWADCLAGVWGYSAYYEGQLEGTDVEEAQAAAWSVGSDLPHELGSPGDHGTRHERLLAFMTGYNSGDANLCFQSDLGGWYG